MFLLCSIMSGKPFRVELRRQALERDGLRETYAFSFIHGRKRVVFVQARDMPPEDVAADWIFAWYEVAKVDGPWEGPETTVRAW